jgi:hypothetical protein
MKNDMERYLVHVYENMYGGMHGIERSFVTKNGTKKEFYEVGAEISRELMESYGIIDQFYDDAKSELEDDDAIEEYVEEMIEDNICVDIYPIRKENDSLSGEELQDILDSEGVNYFINEYCD